MSLSLNKKWIGGVYIMSRALKLICAFLLIPPAAANGKPFHDSYNLAEMGAKLDNSANDKAIIQSIYSALPNGAVVKIPKGSVWDGRIIAPDPTKHVMWDFDGSIGGWYPPPAGDGDVSITRNAGFSVEMRMLNTNSFIYPANYLIWNDDPNFCGAYCNNWQQYAAANFRSISGPLSTGNTSPLSVAMESYGQNPSASYDVGISLNGTKYGQNSMWGIVDDLIDQSGKSPGAFSMWNEYDLWANGEDIKNWDPFYGKPQAGHRSAFFISNTHLTSPSWQRNKTVTTVDFEQGNLPQLTKIKAVSPDGATYIWYAVQGGTTGLTSPAFPSPSRLVASYDGHGNLAVTNVVSGKIVIGDWITGEVPVWPFKIINQTSGAVGGPGVYTVNDSHNANSFINMPVYSDHRVIDNNVIWQFGEEYKQTVSSVLWLTGNDTYDTVIGIDNGAMVSNAALDTSIASFGSTAAAIRVAPGQVLDFSSEGTLATRNQHTIDYENDSLNYKVKGSPILSMLDDGTPVEPVITINATGHAINDAPPTSGPIAFINSVTANAGVKLGSNMTTVGAREEILNNSARTILVYPPSISWSFTRKSAGSPISLPSQATLTVTCIANDKNTVERKILFAEYHLPLP